MDWKKKKKKKQKGQYYTTWLSEAIFYSKNFLFCLGGLCVFLLIFCCCCYCFWCFIAVYLLILPCWWLDIRYGRELWFRLWSNHCWRSRLTTETPTLFLKSSENCQGVLCEFPSKNSAVIIRIRLQWAGCSYWEKFVWAQDRPCVGMLLQRNNGFQFIKILLKQLIARSEAKSPENPPACDPHWFKICSGYWFP